MAEKQIFNGETDRLGTPLVGVATPTPLMNCCFAGNTNFLVSFVSVCRLGHKARASRLVERHRCRRHSVRNFGLALTNIFPFVTKSPCAPNNSYSHLCSIQ